MSNAIPFPGSTVFGPAPAPEVIENPQVHVLDSFAAYDETQTSDEIKDGDVLVIDTPEGKVVGVMVAAWPVFVSGPKDQVGFHTLNEGADIRCLGQQAWGRDLGKFGYIAPAGGADYTASFDLAAKQDYDEIVGYMPAPTEDDPTYERPVYASEARDLNAPSSRDEMTPDERIWTVGQPEQPACAAVRLSRAIERNCQVFHGSSFGRSFTWNDLCRPDETFTFSASFVNVDGISTRRVYAITDAGLTRRIK